MATHKCFNCSKMIDLSKFGCPKCWFSLSVETRNKVNRAYYNYRDNPSQNTLNKLRDVQLDAKMELN